MKFENFLFKGMVHHGGSLFDILGPDLSKNVNPDPNSVFFVNEIFSKKIDFKVKFSRFYKGAKNSSSDPV